MAEEVLRDRGRSLLADLASLPCHKLTNSCRRRLTKLVRSELRFLNRNLESPDPTSRLASTNLGYLQAVVQVLQHPSVDSASAVLNAFASPSSDEVAEANETNVKVAEAHVDVVCTFEGKPVWITVSDRNPKYLEWSGRGCNIKGWRTRVQVLIRAALSNSVLRPAALLFCFAKGVSSSLSQGFETEWCAVRIETFGIQKIDRNDVTETRGISDELGELFREVEDGEWLEVELSRKHVDMEGSADAEFRGPRCSLSTESADIAPARWTTFQVDIDIPLDGFQALNLWGVFNSRASTADLPLVPLESGRSKGIQILEDGVHEKQDTVSWFQVLQGGVDQSLDDCHYASGDDQGFLSFLVTLRVHKSQAYKVTTSNLVNLDTTALVALVSEASNGLALMLVTMSNEDLISRFGNTAQFMTDQAEAELRSPLLHMMTTLLADKVPFISESVCREFKSLVSLCGGLQEKYRADALLELLPMLPDTPSERVMSLCQTGKITKKNKIVFGTGDYWHAPTLTANLAFVRAVRQTGMALSVIEHEPRALVGDKCNNTKPVVPFGPLLREFDAMKGHWPSLNGKTEII